MASLRIIWVSKDLRGEGVSPGGLGLEDMASQRDEIESLPLRREWAPERTQMLGHRESERQAVIVCVVKVKVGF